MFYVVFLVKRRDGISREEFIRYWIDDHTPFTRRVPGLREYCCLPMIGHDGAAPPFDAVAYIGFDDEAAWRRAEQSPEMAASFADAEVIQNTGANIAFFAEKHVIVGEM